ncbi:MAG: ribosome small subunit-dependent GTPase A [Rectinemataceae bacterium]
MPDVDMDFESDLSKMAAFGFDEGFLRDFASLAEPGDMPARIVEVQRGRFSALCAAAASGLIEVEALLSGAFMNKAEAGADFPAVGDWVALRPADMMKGGAARGGASGVSGSAQITAVLPRRSAFLRKAPGDTARDRVEAQVLAANVDSAFIVMAAGRDWNPRRLERYLALAGEAGVQAVIVITKADLAEDPEALLREAASTASGVERTLVCAPEGQGLESLTERLLPGRTIVLLGSSGAGKSTLLNALAGKELAATGEVRADDERGRHTTTHRQLYRLPSGALVIDTPGLREVQLWAEEESVDAVFGEIEEYAALCRFRDCRHEREPGCAVREALERGDIDLGRYESWRKLRRELAYLDSRTDPAARRAEADRWKAINKDMRGYTKERRSIAGKSRD